jgi:hypothetical protein
VPSVASVYTGLPGYHHNKDQHCPFLCKIVHADYDKRYTMKELAHKFGGQRKHKKLTKKSVGKRSNGKRIELDEFMIPGDVQCIAVGCRVFNALKSFSLNFVTFKMTVK